MEELLFKALKNGLLREISVNEFLVLLGYLCGMNDINTFEHTFNISYRTVQNLRPHLCQLGLFDKDGRQYKLNVHNTQAFLQQFVDNDKIDVDDNDSENLASKDSENLEGQNESNSPKKCCTYILYNRHSICVQQKTGEFIMTFQLNWMEWMTNCPI